MADELFTALKGVEEKGKYVFTNPLTGDKYTDRKKLLIGLCQKAKVKRFSFHAFRHFGASTLSSKGVPLSDIQEMLGHENLLTTVRYIQSLGGSTTKSIHLLQ